MISSDDHNFETSSTGNLEHNTSNRHTVIIDDITLMTGCPMLP
jgi:hypothetical protein